MADGSTAAEVLAEDAKLRAHAVEVRARLRHIEFYEVPVEVAMALSTGSAMPRAIRMRAEAGAPAKPMARIFARGDRFFALVDFEDAARSQLIMPLDCWVRP